MAEMMENIVEGVMSFGYNLLNMAIGPKPEASGVKAGTIFWGGVIGGAIGGVIATFLLPGIGTVAGCLLGSGLGMKAGEFAGDIITHTVEFDRPSTPPKIENSTSHIYDALSQNKPTAHLHHKQTIAQDAHPQLKSPPSNVTILPTTKASNDEPEPPTPRMKH